MRTTQWMATTVWALVFAASSTALLSAQTTELQSGPAEGIKVHGHWMIDIKNPDGTPAAHHEFENALQTGGALKLAAFLGRVNAPGRWYVLLYSLAGAANCVQSGVPCVFSEGKALDATGGDLTVSVPTSGPNQDKLVLSGSFTSPDNRSFFRAFSALNVCPAGSPGCQVGSGDHSFTMKDFTPVPVQAGQIVQVTVVISFS
jgi:hypothetical protein